MAALTVLAVLASAPTAVVAEELAVRDCVEVSPVGCCRATNSTANNSYFDESADSITDCRNKCFDANVKSGDDSCNGIEFRASVSVHNCRLYKFPHQFYQTDGNATCGVCLSCVDVVASAVPEPTASSGSVNVAIGAAAVVAGIFAVFTARKTSNAARHVGVGQTPTVVDGPAEPQHSDENVWNTGMEEVGVTVTTTDNDGTSMV
jgi:hypothetical protein